MTEELEQPEQRVRSAKTLREQIGQTVGLLLFGLLVLRQFSLFPDGGGTVDYLRWFLITSFFVLGVLAYAVRRPAVVLARSPLDVVLPLICAGMPLLLTEVPSVWVKQIAAWLAPLGVTAEELWQPRFRGGAPVGLSIAVVGEAVTAAGLYTLRDSFSIFTEARRVVTDGLYAYVRHPLYSGEIATVWGIVLSWPSLWAICLGALFTGLQLWRARREERLLTATFSDYSDYRTRVGALWPRLSAFRR